VHFLVGDLVQQAVALNEELADRRIVDLRCDGPAFAEGVEGRRRSEGLI
jgi:hypothetical protein